MKACKGWIPLLGLLSLALFMIGCTSQGRLTYLTFNTSDDYATLKQSLEELKIKGYDGHTDQQFSAVKNLRYMSKYLDEPGKREMALGALAFLAFYSDDWDVQNRSKYRLKVVLDENRFGLTKALDSDNWSTDHRIAVIQAVMDLVIGDEGYQKEEDDVLMTIPMEVDEREDALDFLMGRLDDMSPYLQYVTVEMFEKFLLTAPSPQNCPIDVCDEDDRRDPTKWETELKAEWSEDYQELKERLWKEIEGWLDDEDIAPATKAMLAHLAGRIHHFHFFPEMEEKFIGIAKEWQDEENIPADVRLVVKGALEKVNLYGVPATKEAVIGSSDYADFLGHSSDFFETHLEAILYQQMLMQDSEVQDSSIPRLDPTDWLFANVEEAPEAQVKRELMLQITVAALNRGLVLRNANLQEIAIRAINSADSMLKRHQVLMGVGMIYPSLKAQNLSPVPLLESLASAAANASNLTEKRLYIQAMLKGYSIFPLLVQSKVDALSGLDVMTRNMIGLKLKTVETSYVPEVSAEPGKSPAKEAVSTEEVIEVQVPEDSEREESSTQSAEKQPVTIPEGGEVPANEGAQK
ncbi:hypothetical protein WDW89_01090 [Deltaproteobacteria bacterium TL4]